MEEAIDIVFPLGKGSVFDNNEIRLSLRSIEKYLTGYRNIYIVGEYPKWLKNCYHIPMHDTEKVSDKNIMLKLKAACNHPDISESFIMFNDDHYLLKPFHAPTFPYFYHKNISDYIKLRHGDHYGRRSLNTQSHLKAKGLPTKYFDCHTPIIYQKKAFIEHVVNSPDWENTWHGFILKSLYANSMQIEGVPIPEDPKYQIPPSKPIDILSTYPMVSAAMQRFLFEKFPQPCTFEK